MFLSSSVLPIFSIHGFPFFKFPPNQCLSFDLFFLSVRFQNLSDESEVARITSDHCLVDIYRVLFDVNNVKILKRIECTAAARQFDTEQLT